MQIVCFYSTQLYNLQEKNEAETITIVCIMDDVVNKDFRAPVNIHLIQFASIKSVLVKSRESNSLSTHITV